MAKIGTNANCITCWPNLEPMLVVKFWTNSSGTTYNWPNLEPMQVVFYLAGEITQVKESISWVRCASGNVYVLYQVISVRTSHQIFKTKYKASTGQKEMYVIFCSSYYVDFLVLFRLKQRFTHSSFTTSKMGYSRTFQLQWYQVGNYNFDRNY